MPQIIIEPFDAATNRAVQIINQKDPSLLKNVKKIVVHSSGGPELGHVAMGPNKDPQEIHLFKNRIKEIVMHNANASVKKTLTAQELEQAICDGILETIAHEASHISGKTRTPEQIAKGPFKGEGEAESGAREFMKKVHPANKLFNLSKRAAQMTMACPHCQADISNIKPEKTSNGLYKMMTCPKCEGYFYPQDAMLAVKNIKERRPDWNMPGKGWWVILVSDWAYGFVDSEAKANLIRERMIKMFVEQGLNGIEKIFPDFAFDAKDISQDVAAWTIARKIYGPEPQIYGGPYEDQEHPKFSKIYGEGYNEVESDLNSILNGQGEFQKTKRRALAEKLLDIHKAEDYTPSKESVVTGGFPTQSNFENANDEVINDPTLNKARAAHSRKLQEGIREVFDGVINSAIKKIKMKEKGIDPDKMCDDVKLASKKKVDEILQFNNSILNNYPKTCISVSKLIKNFDALELINNLSSWQFDNDLEVTGKLDNETITKLAESYYTKALPRNFAPVIPGMVYRGGLIMDESQLQALKDLGIQRVVSLHSNPDIPRLCNKMNVEYVPAFIQNGGPEDLGRKVFGDSVSNFLLQKPTYVHCFFGEDRTGGVIARLRTELGWPCELAYKEAKHYGFKDLFVDMIDWFSEFCDKKPVDTDKIRKALKNYKPYQNPEIMEQDCSFTPAPNDVPYPSSIDNGPQFHPYTDYITSEIPTSISTVPLSLNASIKISQESDVEKLLEELSEEDIENEAKDEEAAANIVGLQECGIEQNMNQGYSLEPFFSNIGDLG